MKKIFALLLFVLPAVAYAGFDVVEEAPAQVVQKLAAGVEPLAVEGVAMSKPAVVPSGLGLVALAYMGEPEGEIEVRRGFGRDVKLIDALKQIAPSDWHAYLKQDVVGKFDKDRLVNWRGSRRWVEVLDILANEQGLLIDVDWKKRHLYVGERKYPAPSSATTYAASSVEEKKLPIWVVKPKSRLRDVVHEFAVRAGWIDLWNYKDEQTLEDKDLDLDGGMRVEGDFKTAIKAVFNSLPRKAKIQVELWSENFPPTVYIMREGGSE